MTKNNIKEKAIAQAGKKPGALEPPSVHGSAESFPTQRHKQNKSCAPIKTLASCPPEPAPTDLREPVVQVVDGDPAESSFLLAAQDSGSLVGEGELLQSLLDGLQHLVRGCLVLDAADKQADACHRINHNAVAVHIVIINMRCRISSSDTDIFAEHDVSFKQVVNLQMAASAAAAARQLDAATGSASLILIQHQF